jgi:uncharacterized protein
MFTTKNQSETSTFDEVLGSFIFMTISSASLFVFLSITFFIMYINVSQHIPRSLSYLFSVVALIILIFTIVLHSAAIYVYKTKQVRSILSFLIKIELNLLLPILIVYSGYSKKYKSNINIFFINLNNIMVKSVNKRIAPEEILVLLPHCMQNSNCSFKITNNICNCQRCYGCNVGAVLDIAEKYNITKIHVASGGTSARSIISKIKPKLIIAVACERELVTGIADVKKTPVIGVLNKRLNGPCINTSVDIDKLMEALVSVI